MQQSALHLKILHLKILQHSPAKMQDASKFSFQKFSRSTYWNQLRGTKSEIIQNPHPADKPNNRNAVGHLETHKLKLTTCELKMRVKLAEFTTCNLRSFKILQIRANEWPQRSPALIDIGDLYLTQSKWWNAWRCTRWIHHSYRPDCFKTILAGAYWLLESIPRVTHAIRR